MDRRFPIKLVRGEKVPFSIWIARRRNKAAAHEANRMPSSTSSCLALAWKIPRIANAKCIHLIDNERAGGKQSPNLVKNLLASALTPAMGPISSPDQQNRTA
jgi:hypothetical protein